MNLFAVKRSMGSLHLLQIMTLQWFKKVIFFNNSHEFSI